MTDTRPAWRVAIAQPTMEWTTAENVAHILVSLAIAAAGGARIAVFPELALTGFHRGIREQGVPEVVGPAMASVQAACRELGIACAIGAPTWLADGTIHNSHVLIDAQGEIAAVTPKEGLTPAEATFFARGSARPVTPMGGLRWASVLCREIEDLEPIAQQLGDAPLDVVLWPGLIGPFAAAAPDDPCNYLIEATAMARRLKAVFVQSNWPNALNVPDARSLGGSKVIAADGEVLLQLPHDEPGVGVFALGERTFHWTPLAA